MSAELAKYACDECRSRKIRCSREATGCEQCKTDARNCVYSRSGVIRRRVKQSKRKPTSSPSDGTYESPSRPEPLTPITADLRSQLDEDIETIQNSLKRFGGPEDDDASGTLATLGAEYSSFWQGPSLVDMAKELGVVDRKFLPFPDEQESLFTKTFLDIQRKGRPIFQATPREIQDDVRCNPERVREKAHLVIAYGVLLTDACLDSSYDRSTITKLRWNLRLALDDAKLLLEPSDINIQALMMLACHVQEVSTPSLCWMIVSNACRMLQVLGINSRNLDAETRERRLHLFWMLNGLDKSLALISGRSPTFPRAMWAKMPLIPLEKLLDYQPHVSTTNDKSSDLFRSMFGAHIMRQMHLGSVVLSDIWSCLFEDGSKFEDVKKSLEDWWQQSSSVLRACQLAEQPFLNDAANRSMQLGIKNQEFYYNYLKVLLIRTRPEYREECVSCSQEALFLLDDLVSDSNEVYNGMIWLLLYCPFTPFFILFGEVLSKGNSASSQRSLEVMEKMVTFLAQMGPRHPRAPKLHTIAVTLVQYAKATLMKRRTMTANDVHYSHNCEESRALATEPSITSSAAHAMDSRPPQRSELPKSATPDQQPLQDLFNDPSVQALAMDWDYWLPTSQSWDGRGTQMDGMDGIFDDKGTTNDPYGFFADSTFDWFSWDPNLGDPSLL